MIQFRMRQIKVEQFAILSDIQVENVNKLSLDTELAVSIVPEIHSISMSIRFAFKEKDNLFMVLEVRCIFEVSDESWEELNKSGSLELPDDFLGHMAMHTVGTARGILFCKTEGTKYASIILPPLNVLELIKHKGQKQ